MSPLRHLRYAVAAVAVIAMPALAQSPAPTPANPWFMAAAFPEASEEVLSATANNKLYVFAGLAPVWKPKALVFEYDPASNQWGKKKPMKLASHHVAFASLNNKIYAFGGFVLPRSGPAAWNPINNAWEYDPATDEWKELAPMPTTRGAASAAAAGGKLLRHRRRQFADRRHRERHPSDAPAQRHGHGRGIRPRDQQLAHAPLALVAAQSSRDRRRRSTDLRDRRPRRLRLHLRHQQQCRSGRVYDPAADLWTARARMPTARSAMGSGVYKDQYIITAGGEGQDQRFLAAFRRSKPIDTTAESLAGAALDAAPRHGFTGGVVGNGFYAVSGDAQSAASGIEHSSAIGCNDALALDLVI